MLVILDIVVCMLSQSMLFQFGVIPNPNVLPINVVPIDIVPIIIDLVCIDVVMCSMLVMSLYKIKTFPGSSWT